MRGKVLALLVGILFSVRAEADRGRVVASFVSPCPRPTGLAFDGDVLWVADHKQDKIVGIDPSSGTVVRSISAPSWRTIGLAFDGHYLWTMDPGDRVAFRLDPKTGVSDRRIELEATSPKGITWRDGKLWVSDASKIHEVDPEDGTTLRTIPAPSKSSTGLAFAAQALWVADRMDDSIYAINPLNGDVYFPIPSPGPYPFGLAEVKGDLFVVDYQDSRIYRLTLATDRLLRRANPKELSVEFTQALRNQGPDDLSEAEILLAIPEHQPWQELISQPSFEPAPVEIVTDEGGQRLARFLFKDIKAQETVSVVMRLAVRLYEVQWEVLPSDVKRLDQVPKDIERLYTRDGSKLLLEHPKIRETAKSLAARADNVYDLVRETYRFVIDRMTYELTGGWNAAPMILERGTGSCSEYSFLTMALLRANRIPARYAGSFVVRGDDASYDEVFHRWVEVYLPGVGWFPIDANHGDKPLPREQAGGFGKLDNRVLVTTQSPGGTQHLGWTYNVLVHSKCNGKCTVKEGAMAEWRPLHNPTQ